MREVIVPTSYASILIALVSLFEAVKLPALRVPVVGVPCVVTTMSSAELTVPITISPCSVFVRPTPSSISKVKLPEPTSIVALFVILAAPESL